MARIAGVELPNSKRVDIALTYLYGIGRVMSGMILEAVKIDPSKRVKDLTDTEVSSISNYISQNYKIEGDLRREVSENIRRLIDIGCYRGSRHRRNLPCRGQRTRTNARTKRGKRRTVGATAVVKAKTPAAAA
ncbi:MAG: 30S ribosomal protein S13 [Elusimicrobiota bacterium]